MSLSYFCPHCGGKNLYEIAKPKFCAKCGANLSSSDYAAVAAVTPKPPVAVNPLSVKVEPRERRQAPPVSRHHEEDEDDDFVGDYSAMGGLDVVIDRGRADRGVSLGELAAAEPDNSSRPVGKRPKPRGRKKLMKSLPDSFVKEAGLSGRGNNAETPDFDEQ